MSSVLSVDVAPGSASTDGIMVSTLELPPDAWYLEAGQGQMPFAVIVEALLQPCSWFSSYLNFFKDTPGDVAFRNLDGDDCIIHMRITRELGTLTSTTLLTRFVNAAGASILFFDVKCECEQGLVMTLKTDFGFFSPELLEEQRGLPTTDEDRARMTAPSPTPAFSILEDGGPLDGVPGIVRGKMRMIDDVTGFWPEGGEADQGRIRTYQKLRPDAWYFKAHFYKDPIQPGSLGLEAMVQSMRPLGALKGLPEGLENPIWEQPALDFPLSWRYRGQVVPTRKSEFIPCP